MKSLKEFLDSNPCTECDRGYTLVGSSIEKCQCLKSWSQEYLLTAKCLKAGLNEEDLKYDIATYIGGKELPTAIDTYLLSFDYQGLTRSTSMRFFGDVDTQKSTVARYMCRELIKKGHSVRFILMNDLINLLMKQNDFTEDVKANALLEIDAILKTDFLVIDESFDSERITIYKSGYQIPFLTTFLKRRLEVVKNSTVFISNKRSETIEEEGFTKAIQSLIIRECLLLEFKDSLHKQHAVAPKNFLDIFK